MTLIEGELFRKIRTQECLGQAWNKKGGIAPNIVTMIERFNVVCILLFLNRYRNFKSVNNQFYFRCVGEHVGSLRDYEA
jgi:hypothetical protein